MGLCLSSGGETAAAEGMVASTAMVLLPTGELREYPRPATAARVLEDVAAEEGCFLCDADAMGFEGHVAAVGAASELRPGQIYFVLPAEVRRRGMRREEVAALAVKASAALAIKAAGANAASSSGCGRRRRGSVAPLVFAPPEDEYDTSVAHKANNASQPAAGKKLPVARGGGKRRQPQRFAPDLTAIPECDMISGE
ncbi:hypothetical protein ABZP36_000012 [Zizania latifolia]